jgi:septum formation protein
MYILLASASPRRKHLLESLGFAVEVKPSPYDENLCHLTNPSERVRFLAQAKLKAAIAHYTKEGWGTAEGPLSHPPYPVLASDTLLDFNGRVLEKPQSRLEAQAMLRELSGETHKVLTAIAVFFPQQSKTIIEVDAAGVTFQNFSDDWLQWYLDQGEWVDAAGAYKLQEKGSLLVKSIQGHPSTVVGLSIPLIYGIFGAIPGKGKSPA